MRSSLGPRFNVRCSSCLHECFFHDGYLNNNCTHWGTTNSDSECRCLKFLPQDNLSYLEYMYEAKANG